MELTGAANANDAMHRLYTADWPRSRVAQMAVTVDRIAAEGDPVAADILRNAARELVLLAASVRRQLFSEEPVRVSWIGGVFQSQIVMERFPRPCYARCQC